MTFYERYTKACYEKGMNPCSKNTAEMFGVSKGTISTWKMKGTIPNGETLAKIARTLSVSADYLLGLTEDKTDYSDHDLVADISKDVQEQLNGDAEKAVTFYKAKDNDALNEPPYILQLYNKLDYTDKIRVESYVEGMLTNDKYKIGRNLA